MTEICQADSEGMECCTEVLLKGGVVVIPTDTVYGLAAHPDHAEAVARLTTIKGREEGKPIALLAADSAAVERFGGALHPKAAELAQRFWPGALTLVLECAAGRTEGFRVPDLEWTRGLLARCGGVLRVTSANLSGALPAIEAAAALASVGLSCDLVVDGGLSRGGVASTVVKCDSAGTLTLLRQGPARISG